MCSRERGETVNVRGIALAWVLVALVPAMIALTLAATALIDWLLDVE